MAKIDLSGNSGWQSKTGDKIKSLQDGSYDYREITLHPDQIVVDWIEPGVIVQVLAGEISLKLDNDIMDYEKDEIIYLNSENSKALEIIIKAEVKLGVFKENGNN